MTDELETLLGPTPSHAETIRNEVFQASLRIVRRQYIVRRFMTFASAMAIFSLGGATVWLLKPARIEREVVYVQPSSPEPAPAVEPTSPAITTVAMTPAELELKAELSDDPAEVARLYREAGDKYLSGSRDYAQAARCYRLHLNAASAELRLVSADDSWLLITLKTSPR